MMAMMKCLECFFLHHMMAMLKCLECFFLHHMMAMLKCFWAETEVFARHCVAPHSYPHVELGITANQVFRAVDSTSTG
ncbi:hypothetical protein F4824DRAFT_460957 [Ustulina deusta]|nr:hypothetical protein F4824DRAFT_460957 [Ustulina deusta]